MGRLLNAMHQGVLVFLINERLNNLNTIILFKSELSVFKNFEVYWMQLDHLSLSELQVLRVKVDQEIESRRVQVRKEGLEKIKSIAAEYGLSADELKTLTAANKVAGKRGSVAPKYRDPNDTNNTWTGRGRKPKWVEAYLATGADLNAIAI